MTREQTKRMAAFQEQDRLYTKYKLDEEATLIDLERLTSDEEFARLVELMDLAELSWKWEREVRQNGPIQP